MRRPRELTITRRPAITRRLAIARRLGVTGLVQAAAAGAVERRWHAADAAPASRGRT